MFAAGVLIVALLAAAGSSAQSWTPLASGTLEHLNAVESGSFPDCLVVGAGGVIQRTDDGDGICHAVPPDFVFADGFESDGLSLWSTTSP